MANAKLIFMTKNRIFDTFKDNLACPVQVEEHVRSDGMRGVLVFCQTPEVVSKPVPLYLDVEGAKRLVLALQAFIGEPDHG